MIFVSACLAGINCKYSGGTSFNQKIFDMVKEGNAIPICPEQYVIDNKRNDLTKQFEKGVKEVIEFAKQLGAKSFILQPRSPSCWIRK